MGAEVCLSGILWDIHLAGQEEGRREWEELTCPVVAPESWSNPTGGFGAGPKLRQGVRPFIPLVVGQDWQRGGNVIPARRLQAVFIERCPREPCPCCPACGGSVGGWADTGC